MAKEEKEVLRRSEGRVMAMVSVLMALKFLCVLSMYHAHIKCFLSIVCLILLHLYEILLLFSDEENEVRMTTSHFSTIT